MSDDRRCLPELGGGGGGQFYHGKGMKCTCVRIEIGQDADQKVKWFLKFHKTYKLLGKAYFQLSFFPSFYSGSHFTIFFIFTHPPPLAVVCSEPILSVVFRFFKNGGIFGTR